MGDSIVNPKDLIEMADKLGLIESIKTKLINQPDKAAEKLNTALEELSKIYISFEAELVRYLALTFDANHSGELKKEQDILLLELAGGAVKVRMSKAKGSCEKLWNIYDRYLKGWFNNALDPEESKSMLKLFSLMHHMDMGMLKNIDDLSDWLETESNDVSVLVKQDKYDEANQRIAKARQDILPSRRAISKAMAKISDLQADFVGISRAI